MASLLELARLHTRIDAPGLAHLQRLVGAWGMLSDLCFADLVLFVPVAGGGGSRFVILGQVRPTTSQTLHRDDLVGRIMEEVERPLVARSLRLGEIVEGEISVPPYGERARVQCIPVRWRGEVVAVMTRESTPSVGRRPGELERVYVETFDRFARMITNGEFPFPGDDIEPGEAPRVGDGVVMLDDGMRISYGSPNAVSALHRMGISSNVEGMRFDELGIKETAVRAAYATGYPVSEEVDRMPQVVTLVRCIPLLDDNKVSGALVLLRDVTQLRRLDRLLVSKDATIREVHHRVKNNLQMISSLLRLQARRLEAQEGKLALAEAERRLQAIARVHDILSREGMDQVPFDEIIDDLIRVAADSAFSIEQAVEFAVDGEVGDLPAPVATPLAVVLQEVLQNAIEHAFVSDKGEPQMGGRIELTLSNDGETATIVVSDNGRGLPEGFTVESSPSLGLSIVRSLVSGQLTGSIEMHSAGKGTEVVLKVPVAPQLTVG
ncbi:MAG: sensor histidine kinase [Acidimicrobiales bacterium]